MKLRPTRNLMVALAAALLCFVPSGCTRMERADAAAKFKATFPSAADVAAEERIVALSHFANGVRLELNENPAEALESYWHSLLLDPTNFELAVDVSRRLLANGEKERALVLLKSTAGQPQAPGTIYTWLALAHLQCGQTNQALQANQIAIRKAPDNLAAYQNQAHLYLQLGQTNQALKVLDQAASVKNSSPEFLVILAENYLHFMREDHLPGNAAKAKILPLLERAERLDSANPIVLQKVGDLYLVLGEGSKAIPAYEKLLSGYPRAPGIKEKLANLYLRTNNKEKATEYFEKLRQERPTDPATHYLLGTLAFESRDPAKAEEFFETALKLNPEFEPIYYDLAGAKLTLRKTEEALEVLEKARSKFKLNFILEYYTGLAKSAQEKYAEAVTYLTSAELLGRVSDPGRLNAQFYFQLGASQERTGNVEQAAEAFRKAVELKPDFAEALNYLGYMWAERGENLEEAHVLIQKAVELEPENAAFLDSLAWVLFKLQRPKEALEQMLKAIAHAETPDPTLYDHLGDIYAELQQFNEAREAWLKSLDVEPNDKVKEKLERLKKRE